MHWAANGPWWFSSDGSQRFDLRRANGTCYVAERPMGAFLEVAARFQVIKRADLGDRRLAEVTIDRDIKLADYLAPRAASFGVKAEVSAGYPYKTVSQPWARLFWRAGFDGVRYGAGHHPALSEVSFALFGDTGATAGYGSFSSADQCTTETLTRGLDRDRPVSRASSPALPRAGSRAQRPCCSRGWLGSGCHGFRCSRCSPP